MDYRPLIPFLIISILASVGCKSTIDAPLVQPNVQSLSDPACPNISGIYALFGDPLPGMPNFFRVHALKPSLDVLLGMDLSDSVKQNTERVRLVQHNTIEMAAVTSVSPPVRQLTIRENDKLYCERQAITIQLRREGRGEAVHGTNVITHKLLLGEDGSLTVQTTIDSLSTTPFMAVSNPREDYGVRFKRINQPANP